MKKTIAVFLLILTGISFAVTRLYHVMRQPDISYYKGRGYFIKGEYARAIGFYEKVLTMESGREDVLTDLAYSYYWTGQKEKAEPYFKKVLELNPRDNKAKKVMARILSWNKEYEKSIALYKEVLTVEDDTEAERQLGEVYIWNRQYEEAKNILENILKADPKDSEAKLLLAKALHFSGKAAEAAGIYEELLREEKERAGQ